MDPVRSLLFIPGHRERWIADSPAHDADVVVLDLEDSVPPGETQAARDAIVDSLGELADAGQRVFVRINGHPGQSADAATHDVEAVVRSDVESILVPKIETPRQVRQLDAILGHVERRKGLATGTVSLTLAVETAPAMYHVHDLCTASERVRAIVCGAPKGTDPARALGYEWSGAGRQSLETLHLRQKALLDARAAGLTRLFSGPHVDIDDADGLREDIAFSKQMGYTGYLAIHPSQVAAINDAFTPDEETVEYWLGLRETFRNAPSDQRAVRYRGEMVDAANLETAEQFLRMAKAYEDDLDIDVDS